MTPHTAVPRHLLLGLKERRPEARLSSASPVKHSALPQPHFVLVHGRVCGDLAVECQEAQLLATVSLLAQEKLCPKQKKQNDRFCVGYVQEQKPLGIQRCQKSGCHVGAGAQLQEAGKRGDQSYGDRPLCRSVVQMSFQCPKINAAMITSLNIRHHANHVDNTRIWKDH